MKLRIVLFMLLTFLTHVLFGQWTQMGEAIYGEINDGLGASVATSFDGSVIAIGAIENEGVNSQSAKGYVQVFKWSNNSWIQVGKNIEGKVGGEQSGFQVSLSEDGNILAISAPYYSSEKKKNTGQLRIYKWNGRKWKQMGNSISGNRGGDWFGHSMSLSANGKCVIVGSPPIHQVEIFSWDGKNWKQLGQTLKGESEKSAFGTAVAISKNGSRIAIGIPSSRFDGFKVGKVCTYDLDGDVWRKLGDENFHTSENSFFGGSISLSHSGEYLAVGAKYASDIDKKRGQTRVYKYKEGVWDQMGLAINGETEGEHSGTSVSLSHDGKRLAIGAPFNKYRRTRLSKVRIFEWIENAWIPVNQGIYAKSPYDYSQALALSPDGNRICIGSKENRSVAYQLKNTSNLKDSIYANLQLVISENLAFDKIDVLIIGLSDLSNYTIELQALKEGKVLSQPAAESLNFSVKDYPKGVYTVTLKKITDNRIIASKKLKIY